MHGWVSEWLREWSLDVTCHLVGRFYEAFPQAFQCLHSSTCQRTKAFEIHVPRVNTVTFCSLKLTRSSISSLHLVVLAKPSLSFPQLWLSTTLKHCVGPWDNVLVTTRTLPLEEGSICSTEKRVSEAMFVIMAILKASPQILFKLWKDKQLIRL